MKKLAKLVGLYETRYVDEWGDTAFVIEEISVIGGEFVYMVCQTDEPWEPVAYTSFTAAEVTALAKVNAEVAGTVFLCDLTGGTTANVP